MAELVANCPRCRTRSITFDVTALNPIGQRGWQHIFEAFAICRHCKRSSTFVLEGRGKLGIRIAPSRRSCVRKRESRHESKCVIFAPTGTRHSLVSARARTRKRCCRKDRELAAQFLANSGAFPGQLPPSLGHLFQDHAVPSQICLFSETVAFLRKCQVLTSRVHTGANRRAPTRVPNA